MGTVSAAEAPIRFTELRRAVTELGLWGGHLGSNVDGRYLDAPEYAPIFAAAVADWRAAQPAIAPPDFATNRDDGKCAVSQSTHSDAAVSNVAFPVAIPSR